MARRTSRRNFSRMSGAPRKMIWVRGESSFVLATAGSVDLLAPFRSLMGITANLPGSTVVRLHMDGQVNYDPAGTAIVDLDGILVSIIREETTSPPPSPLVDLNADWMFWRWFPVTNQVNASRAFTAGAGNTVYSWHVDNKSMRKIEEPQETLWLSWANTAVAPVQSTMTVYWSLLVKLA